MGSRDLQAAVVEYYALRGRNAEGIPNETTLVGLDVDVRLNVNE